jgi:tetratricopeptide (TPR) repeat protein
VLVLTGDCEASIAYTEKILAVDPENASANESLGLKAFRCGDFEKTIIETNKYLLHDYSRGQFTEDSYKEIEKIYKEKGFSEAYKKIMNEWEELYNQGFIYPCLMAGFYIFGNQQDKAMDCLEKAYNERDPFMPMIATKLMPFDSLYDNPRFIALVKKMNLPLP